MLGRDFSGKVVAVGKNVTRFVVNDAVYGVCETGGHAEYLVVGSEAPLCHKSEALGFDAAAAVPFGAMSALVFLRDFAAIKPGHRVLVLGASGGVGVFAVQLAKEFGAQVTGVCSAGNMAAVRALGADHVIDYQREDFSRGEATFDVILDTVSATSFATCHRVLADDGLYVPLEFEQREIWDAVRTWFRGGKRVVIGISGDTPKDLAVINGLLDQGRIRPVIDGHYTLDQISQAHRRVESRHKTGAVVVTVDQPDVVRLPAA